MTPYGLDELLTGTSSPWVLPELHEQGQFAPRELKQSPVPEGEEFFRIDLEATVVVARNLRDLAQTSVPWRQGAQVTSFSRFDGGETIFTGRLT
ncbi:MAG: hypothetical protein BGO11_03900 [Solirubrobacterales bacterium 70-9]|nr:MAG: hypothetical protein BGO11_03900 [Solirubrobacterales bacterium 70-9]